jgi:hypothetical protein
MCIVALVARPPIKLVDYPKGARSIFSSLVSTPFVQNAIQFEPKTIDSAPAVRSFHPSTVAPEEVAYC